MNWQSSRTIGCFPPVCFLLVFFFAALRVTPAQAQFFSAGNDPSGVRWKQVKEEQIRIIFPEGYEEQAVALILQLKTVRKEAAQTLPPDKIVPISVVLHNQTAQANGFVAWAPKRMELFTLADQHTYPQDWLQQLAVHEFRHVVQINNMRQGLTKVLSYLLGEQAIGAVIGLYVPVWFLEGDAVAFETAYTKTGRGRTPSFFIPYVAMLDRYGGFCYEKAVLGSYKHFVPDQYVVGYHLVSYTRFRHGEELWKSALDEIARRPYSIMPLSRTLKKYTGLSKFKWYTHTARQIRKSYAEPVVPVQKLSQDFSKGSSSSRSDFVSYRFPQYINDSVIVAEKSGLSYVKEWVLIDRQGREQHLLFPGFYNISTTSVTAGKLYYTEYKFDKRWTHRLWTDVVALDLKKRKRKFLTKKKYAASPSAHGERLVYVQQTPFNEFELVLTSKEAPEVLAVKSPRNQMLYTPVWESDSTVVCIALDKEKGKYFTRINLNTQQWTALSAPLYYDIQQPLTWKHYIVHRGAYESKEQVYAYDTLAKQRYRITRETYGATDPAIRNGILLFSSYTATGFVVKEQALDTAQWIPVALPDDHWDNRITRAMTRQETAQETLTADTLTASFAISKYRKMAHLFNFHSWAPLYVDVDNATVNPGASVFSQNLLSTSFLSMGYLYDYTEQTGKWIMRYQYTGFYPVLSFSASQGDRFMTRYGRWKQVELDAGISLPFNLTHGPYSERLTLTFAPHWQRIYDVQENSPLVEQELVTTSYRLDYSRLFRLSPRDLRPQRGQSFFLQYRHAPFGDFTYSSFVAGAVSVWMPSVVKHHSILLRGQGHHYDKGGRYLSSPVAFPRGYSYLYSPDLLRGSIDYAFPLFYPDWRWTALFYIKRIKLNLFYDAAWSFRDTGTFFYDSKGIDFRVDFHFANFLAPIDLGIRLYHLNARNSVNYQILLAYQLGR